MKKIILALTLIMTLIVPFVHAAADTSVSVASVTAICQTQPEGEKFVALAIEYSEPFMAGEAVLGSFTVSGRDVTRVYVNESGLVGDVQSAGHYIMVELAVSNVPGASLGTTLYYGRMNDMSVKLNHRLPVEVVISQASDLTAISGNVAQGKRLYITAESNPLVDSFEEFSFTDPESGVTVNYRLYIPEGYREKVDGLDPLPLVMFLHGSGERGYNNASQLLANPSALEFARAEAQEKHPCFVFAPQNPDPSRGWAANIGTEDAPNWATTEHLEAAKKIIDELIKTYNIDTSRLYGSGLSQGSKGTMRMSMNYPELFAAQVNAAGCDVYTDEEVAAISHKPIWHIIAVDDSTNPSGNVRKLMEQLELGGAKVVRNIEDEGWNGWARGEASAALAQAEWDEAQAEGANVLYAEYIAATVVPNTHWSWMATFSNEVVRDWLFAQVNPVPYAPQ